MREWLYIRRHPEDDMIRIHGHLPHTDTFQHGLDDGKLSNIQHNTWDQFECSLTEPSASSWVDLPELDAFLHASRSHGTLTGVALPVAGTQRLLRCRTGLRWVEDEGLAGEGLHPAHCVQTVLTVFARVCGDRHSPEYQPQQCEVQFDLFFC